MSGNHANTQGALQHQVDGDHYKAMAIQPVEYIHANGLGFCEGAIVKYVSRWRQKGGLKDLEKIKHFVDLLIELECRRAPVGVSALAPEQLDLFPEARE